MPDVNEIDTIKGLALKTFSAEEKEKCIDTLVAYGEPAIIAIAEIADSTLSSDTRQYALDAIIKIKGRKT